MSASLKHVAGELIMLSLDMHSDYHIARAGIVLKDFDAAELLLEWAKEFDIPQREKPTLANPTGTYIVQNEDMKFQDWLFHAGYIMHIKTKELNVGYDNNVRLSDPYPDFWKDQGGEPLELEDAE